MTEGGGRAGKTAFLTALRAGAVALAFSTAVALCACGAPVAEQQPSSSAVSEEAAAPEEQVVLRVAAPVGMQGVLEELAAAYCVGKDGLSFEFQYFNSAKKENRELAPDGSSEGNAASLPLMPPSSSTSGESSSSVAAAKPPKAELVFQNSLASMDAAEEAGVADPTTRSDMLQDSLVFVTSADSKVGTVTTADIEAGAVNLAVVEGTGLHAKRQFEVLESLGVYEDGKFRGYYGRSAHEPQGFENTAKLFDAVAHGDGLVAIVRTSDLYRYGSVRVAGAVPADLYTAMWFPQALGCNLGALEDGDRVSQLARDFLGWIESDGEAIGIVEKWGFRLAA